MPCSDLKHRGSHRSPSISIMKGGNASEFFFGEEENKKEGREKGFSKKVK